MDEVSIEVTEETLLEALWQSFSHLELDDFVCEHKNVDGNDSPALKKLASRLFQRLAEVQ